MVKRFSLKHVGCRGGDGVIALTRSVGTLADELTVRLDTAGAPY